MKTACLVTLGAVLMALTFLGVAYAGSKVQICHLPPGNPANFHTITLSENALPAHLAHGDLPGSCHENAEALCDDGDACTIDAMNPATETCLVDHPPVDCDDGLFCTNDSCDSADGCQYAPILCDDGDLCTVDICNPLDGQCTATPIECGPLGLCLPATGDCDYPCDGITCEPIDQCHEAGECVLPGECVDGPPLPDGTPCDDGDAGTIDDQCTGGVCGGTPSAICPCFTTELIDSYPYSPWDEIQAGWEEYTFEYIECVDSPDTLLITWAWSPYSESVHTWRWVWVNPHDDNPSTGVCGKKVAMHALGEYQSMNQFEMAACIDAILESQAWAQHCP